MLVLKKSVVFCFLHHKVFVFISTKNKIEAYKLTLILLLMSATDVKKFQEILKDNICISNLIDCTGNHGGQKIRSRGKFLFNNFMYIWPIKAFMVSN